MNVLFLFGHDLVLGGHFKSARAFASSLLSRGHKIFVMAPGGSPETIEPLIKAGCVFNGIKNTNRHNASFIKRLNRLLFPQQEILSTIKKNDIDIIHAHDSPIIWEAYYAACLTNCGFVYSQAGGGFVDTSPPPKALFFVFSQELIEGYKKIPKYNTREIQLIRERIDTKTYTRVSIDEEFKSIYRLPKDGIKLFIAIRLHEQKKPWLECLLYLASSLGVGTKANIIIAGDGSLTQELKMKADAIHSKTKGKVSFLFVGAVYSESEIAKFINYTDVYVGNGRGLMEAMGCGRPVIILGENERFEFVTEANVDIISKYNFSGRHFRWSKKCKRQYVNETTALLNNKDALNSLATFSQLYVQNNLSADIGAAKIERLYQKALTYNNSKIDAVLWKLKKVLLKQSERLKLTTTKQPYANNISVSQIFKKNENRHS